MSRYAHIIPLGLDFDRTNFLLKEYPPFRMHFLNPDNIEKKYEHDALEIRKKIVERWPEPHKEYHTVHCFDFHSILIDATKIMAIESSIGNKIVPHIFSGSRLYAIALYVAACLAGQQIEYIRARDYQPRTGCVMTSGVDPSTLLVLDNFPFVLPGDFDCALLQFLADHANAQRNRKQETCWEGQRTELWKAIKPYLQDRGIKMTSNPLVKLSNHLTDLETGGFVIRSAKKKIKLGLTPSGSLCAESADVLYRVKRIKQETGGKVDFRSYLLRLDNTSRQRANRIDQDALY